MYLVKRDKLILVKFVILNIYTMYAIAILYSDGELKIYIEETEIGALTLVIHYIRGFAIVESVVFFATLFFKVSRCCDSRVCVAVVRGPFGKITGRGRAGGS